MNKILKKLSGGDRRSIGRSKEVVLEVLQSPSIIVDVMEGLTDDDPIICMRASDVIEKVSSHTPEIILPHKEYILKIAQTALQKEVRWHIAQIIPRLDLSSKERKHFFSILLFYLNDQSKIVKTFSMQALADISLTDKKLKQKALKIIKELTETGSPAMKNRGKKLLKKII